MTIWARVLAATLALAGGLSGCGIGNGHSCGAPHEGPCDVADNGSICMCINHDPAEGPREECGDPGEHGGDTCTPATIQGGTDVGCCAQSNYPALNAQCLCRANQPPASCAAIGDGWFPIGSCAVNGTLSSL